MEEQKKLDFVKYCGKISVVQLAPKDAEIMARYAHIDGQNQVAVVYDEEKVFGIRYDNSEPELMGRTNLNMLMGGTEPIETLRDIGEHPYAVVYDALRKAVEYSRTKGNALLIRVSHEKGFVCFFADGSVKTASRLLPPNCCAWETLELWRDGKKFDEALIRDIKNDSVFTGFKAIFGCYSYLFELKLDTFAVGDELRIPKVRRGYTPLAYWEQMTR